MMVMMVMMMVMMVMMMMMTMMMMIMMRVIMLRTVMLRMRTLRMTMLRMMRCRMMMLRRKGMMMLSTRRPKPSSVRTGPSRCLATVTGTATSYGFAATLTSSACCGQRRMGGRAHTCSSQRRTEGIYGG